MNTAVAHESQSLKFLVLPSERRVQNIMNMKAITVERSVEADAVIAACAIVDHFEGTSPHQADPLGGIRREWSQLSTSYKTNCTRLIAEIVEGYLRDPAGLRSAEQCETIEDNCYTRANKLGSIALRIIRGLNLYCSAPISEQSSNEVSKIVFQEIIKSPRWALFPRKPTEV